MTDTRWTPIHLAIQEDDLATYQKGGRVVLLPGSPERAELIAQQFRDCRRFPSARALDVYVGTLNFPEGDVDVAVVSTGMGCPSVNIVVSELLLMGVRRFLRVGTAGSLQPGYVRFADVVIATGAVRDEGASLAYAPLEIPALASFELVTALRRAAVRIGLADYTHLGLVHTKDSLYGREFGHGAMDLQNEQYLQTLKRLGILATEMEASHLFILGTSQKFIEVGLGHPPNSAPCLVGSLLAIVGENSPFSPDPQQHSVAIERAISIAFQGIRELHFGPITDNNT
jgi:uridine phosphorylase